MPEAGATDFTWIRLLSSVDEHMGTEVGHLHKSGPTGFTFVGLFSRVNSSVGLQVGWPIELRSTDVTAVGLLTCRQDTWKRGIIFNEGLHCPLISRQLAKMT